jgi:hypothetical protein
LAAAAALSIAGCGGSGSSSTAKTSGGAAQDASHTFKIEVLDVTFKPAQKVGRPAKMRIEVRNVDSEAVPNVAVALDSFYYGPVPSGLPASKQPVWVVRSATAGPPATREVQTPKEGSQTLYVNTWALGELAPNQTRTFEWTVIPRKSGLQHVNLEILAAPGGKPKATLPNGTPLTARFRSEIAPAS